MEQKMENTALLVMDMQAGIVAMLPDSAGLLVNVGKAIAYARKKSIPVIYVVVGFRQGMPEVSYKNKSFFMFKERLATAYMAAFSTVHADLAPAEGEVTVIKRRVSAFTGSDLEVILRAYDVQHIVLTGIATSGVVLSTLREAADKDYSISVIADCCADRDEEVHRLLTTKVFTNQSEVLSLVEWCR
jgi:nicotinamidase-related amidase